METNRKFLVYYHKSKDGRYYIGQTCQSIEERCKSGNGYKTLKFNIDIINENGGWDSFEHGVLERNLTKEEADEREAYYITYYNSVENGFNTYKMNYSGYHFSDLWDNPTIKSNIIDKLKKQRNTKEYKEKKSKQMKELWQSDSYKKKQKQAWTEERKKKISDIAKRVWENKDIRERISKIQSELKKQAWQNEEYRRKMCKQVRCVETGEIFESIAAAAKWCGVKANTLCAALSSKTHQSGRHPESKEKLHWERYIDEVGKGG